MRRLNERMVGRSRRGTFCTAALVVLNLRTGNLMAANAGHHPVLRISSDHISSCLPASGPPVGILDGVDWDDEESNIRPGETLLLYTDGIAEARDGSAAEDIHRDEDEYGVAGIERIARMNRSRGPRELIEAVLADVDRFCEPLAPHDDCTMIALKYNGHG
jgi:sigma-B regulation protein RsbU (phosphoserine phosphatase)